MRVVVADFLSFPTFSFYGWNWTYFVINAVGAFASGLLAAIFRFRFPSARGKWYAFVAEAAAGSFTAFDLVFSQISLIVLQPDLWILVLYVGVNFAACIVCSALGIWLGSGKKIIGKRRKGSGAHSGPKEKKRAAGARHGY